MRAIAISPRSSRGLGVPRLPSLALGAVLACALFLPSAAHADFTFCSFGEGAGQCREPTGLDVDRSVGDVYVADRENNRIDVFAADGSFKRAFGWEVIPSGGAGDTGVGLETCTTASTCKAGLAGSGPGQLKLALSGPDSVAVDNDPASPAYHDVYVFDGENRRVQRYHPSGEFVLAFGGPGTGAGQFDGNDNPIAVGPGGILYVAGKGAGEQSRVQEFEPSGVLIKQIGLVRDECEDGKAPNQVPLKEGMTGLAVDGAGGFYVANVGSTGVRKYDAAGNLLLNPCAPIDHGSGNVRGIAVDAAGDLFVGDNSGGTTAIHEYGPAGALTHVHYGNGTLEGRSLSLAPFSDAGGDLFAVEGSSPRRLAHFTLDPAGPAVVPFSTEADPIGNVKATLSATVNPEGAATTYHFEYISAADYAANGNSFAGAHAPSTTPETAAGSDFKAHQLSGEATGLAPETAYRFRIVANDGAHSANGPTASFTTRSPFEFGDIYPTAVGISSATLNGELNPLGIATAGHFEYVEDATFQADKASGDGFQHAVEAPDVSGGSPPLDFGEAPSSLIARSVSLSGLAPDTTYHFRLIAEDAFVTRPGPESTFHTYLPLVPNTACPNQQLRTATPSAPLADCRAYEMVSPLEKSGGEIAVLVRDGGNRKAGFNQAAPSGERITFASARAFADPNSAPFTSQYLASRDPAAGWQSKAITPPTNSLPLYGLSKYDNFFQAFDPDLCRAFYLQTTDFALTAGDQPGYPDLYRVRGCGDPTGYDLLSTAAPSNLPPGGFITSAAEYHLRVQGSSAAGSLVVFRARGKLATNGTAASTALVFDATGPGGEGIPVAQLYLSGAGSSLRLVSILPDGSAAGFGSSVGRFSGAGTTGDLGYQEDTLANAVSADGTRVFWSGPFEGSVAQPKLYLRMNADRAQSPVSGGHCTDPARGCTLAVSESVDPGAAKFWDATPQGTKALFSFTVGAHANQLYSYDVATQAPSLIAAGFLGLLGASEDLSKVYLVSKEVLDPGPNSEGDVALAGGDNVYFYREGQGFRFIGRLLGSGVSGSIGDSNDYTHFPYAHRSRVSPDGNHLAFISQAPLTGYDNVDPASGDPGTEVYLYDATASAGTGKLLCASCNPSGARPVTRIGGFTGQYFRAAAQIPGWPYSLRASAALSEDGKRLFFESFDGLLPTDTNGKGDVYEWEAPGSGDCAEAHPDYFASNGGCLSLISSGQSANDSTFVDASSDGRDVFLLSGQKLYAGDTDTALDLYDARAGGGFPPPPASPPPCDLDAGACEGAASSAPEIQGAGTAVFQGPGDQPARGASKCPKGKHRVRVKGKPRCVKPHGAKGHRKARHDRGAGR